MPDLAAIRARADAATPGPWIADTEQPGDCVVWAGDVPSDETRDTALLWNIGTAISCIGQPCSDHEVADCQFIAHAREDIPALLDALSAAEANAATRVARSEYDRVLAALATAEERADAAERRGERMRNALEWALDWLSSFSMPPSSTIQEKEEAMARMSEALARAASGGTATRTGDPRPDGSGEP